MNIDKLIANEMQSRYSDRVETTLNEKGLTFTDLRTYLRVGNSNEGRTDSVFKTYCGNDAKIPMPVSTCVCRHEITQQCDLCPEGSKNIDEIITVGNKCIHKWGYDPAIRGKREFSDESTYSAT